MTKSRVFVAGVTLIALAIPTMASAGKAERDKQKELTPKVTAAKATIKSTCGCDVAVLVKWESYKTADDMNRVPQGLEDILTATKPHCSGADEKKVFCSHVTAYELYYNSGGGVKVDGKKVSCGTSDTMHCGDQNVSRELDKF